MKTRIYLVKKDPDQIGEHIDWIQMTGAEFTAFRRSPEGRGRFFIHLSEEPFDDGSDILIEATRAEYLRWKAGQDHHYYLQMQSRGREILSLDAQVTESATLEDCVALDEPSIEDFVTDMIQREQLSAALDMLPVDERSMIRIMFYGEAQLSEEETARKLGMSKSALHRWKIKIFGKIKKIMRTKS